jgi:hypothetical protein
MSDDWKNDRLEAEIAKHEMELMKKAHLKRLASAPVEDRVKYVLNHSGQDDWTADDLLEELTELQISDGVSLADISRVLNKR